MEETNIWVVIITNLVTLLSGGGLGWLFTIKSMRKQHEADAMKSAQEVYRGVIEDLNADRQRWQDVAEKLQIELEARDRELSNIKRQIQSLQRQLAATRTLLCGDVNCPKRQKYSLKNEK
jgi:predicted  nucleic acid-binding Zn-ribbon protein